MKKLILMISIVLIFNGCARVKVEEGHTLPMPKNKERVAAINNWDFQGKVFVTDGKSGNNALIYWKNQGKNYNIKVHAPIGGDYVIISKLSDTRYELVEANGQKLVASSFEGLMQQKLGWYLPLQGLNIWIKGVPVPGVKVSNLEKYPNNTLKFLQQNGWDINYLEYKNFNQLYLPTKIHLNHNNIRIKIFIRSWEIYN